MEELKRIVSQMAGEVAATGSCTDKYFELQEEGKKICSQFTRTERHVLRSILSCNYND